MNIFKKILTVFGATALVTSGMPEEKEKPKYWLPFQIEYLEDGPEELMKLLPIRATIINKMESPDGGEYYLASLNESLSSNDREISYIIVGGRFVGGRINPEMKDLSVNIALVTDNNLIKEEVMDFDKAEFTAIGTTTTQQIK